MLLYQFGLSADILQLGEEGLVLVLDHENVLLKFLHFRLYFGSLKVNIFHGLFEKQGLLFAITCKSEAHPIFLTL
jgi:hypothetical protein